MSENFGQSIVNTLVGELTTIRNQQRRSWPPTIRQQQQPSAADHQINNNIGIELANGAREDVLKDVAERIEAMAKEEFKRRIDQFLADKRKSDTQRNNEQRAIRRQEAYKTELCKRFMRTGQCQYREQCRFAHVPEELRVRQLHSNYKTKLCRNYSRNGFCYYGHRCQFLHRTPPNSPLENRRPLALSAITFNNGVGDAMKNGPMFLPQQHPMPITSNPQFGSAFTGHPFTGPYMIFSPPAYVDQNGFGIPNALFTASTPIGNTQFPFPPPTEEFLRR